MGKPSKRGTPRTAPQRLHRTLDIPQANRLENIRQLAAAVRDGIRLPSALLELLDVDQRHFAYYRQAALILGVVAQDDVGGLILTDRGRALLATADGSAEERACFRDAIRAAPSLRPFSSYFEGQKVSVEDLAHRLGVLTGLSFTTAKRRAQTFVQWRKYVDEPERAAAPGPDIPDLTEQLDGLVARHNALAKQRYLAWLLQSEPRRLEEITGALVEAMGYSDVRVVGRSGDGGVDVRALRRDEWGHNTPCAIQVKRYSKAVGRRVIDEMVGVMAREKCASGILITTSDFSKHALAAAAGEPRLRLVNGAQFVQLLAEHGVGLCRGRHGEILWCS